MYRDALISVIVPIYNVEKYLEKCIYSITNQTYKNLEIILVNDGSTDNCSTIIDSFIKLDNRIKYFFQENAGLSAARNTGIENASGDYYLFIDSDDYIHPRMVEILYNNLKEYNADISICDLHWIEEGESVGEYVDNNPMVYSGKDVLRKLIGDDLISVVAWNKLYKKEIFEEIRYPVGRIHEDEFVIHRILAKCHKSVYTDAKLYFYIKRKGSIVSTQSSKSLGDGFLAFCERFVWAFPKKDKVFTDWCFDVMLNEANYIIYKTNTDEHEVLVRNVKKMIEQILKDLPFSTHITWRKIIVGKVWIRNPKKGNSLRRYLHC
ncbi:glycosyltransferase family 2 protein [Butyrivibrio sp. AE2015]|uniref:glycosyltransferase family 2 protein n=1 Tax=Butyrivibrio sp. AE2015 TaxID=1280663 RepID=UPI0003B5E7E6|nr:glycosyltransferase family 2 protein [Butyrivibrio sp. AE2015]